MAKKQSFINRLINIASVFVIIGAITAISILATRYVQTVNENKKLVAIKTRIENDYKDLLDHSEKLKDDTYYSLYFEDKYLVIDKDNIIVEFKWALKLIFYLLRHYLLLFALSLFYS